MTLQLLCGPQGREPATFVFGLGFLALFAFITTSGLVFVHNPQRTELLMISTALQIPWVSSPLLAYRLAAGFQVSVALIGGRLNGGFRLGSDFQINVLQRLPWGVGVNLFALLLLVLLVRSRRAPNPSVQRMPGSLAVPESDVSGPPPLS